VDSFPAIAVSVERTLDDLGAPRPTAAGLRAVVGAPLNRVFAHVLGPSRADLIEPAITRYRVHFDDVGMARIQAFPGIGDALQAFRLSGHAMRVVTARSAPSAALILRQLALDEYFDDVHAPEPAVRFYEKADHVKTALERAGAAAANALMIGDRADDVRAAGAHGVPAIGVLWGNGSLDELEAAGAAAVVTDASELTARVGAWRADVVGSSRG
jgi:phosphoglycolate phosphatase